MQDAANAPASSVCSGFRAGLYYESRILGRTPAFWLALAALGATIALALFTGAARVHAQRETIVSARADEAPAVGERVSLTVRADQVWPVAAD